MGGGVNDTPRSCLYLYITVQQLMGRTLRCWRGRGAGDNARSQGSLPCPVGLDSW